MSSLGHLFFFFFSWIYLFAAISHIFFFFLISQRWHPWLNRFLVLNWPPQTISRAGTGGKKKKKKHLSKHTVYKRVMSSRHPIIFPLLSTQIRHSFFSTRVTEPALRPAGHLDLRAQRGEADEHRRLAPRLRTQLPRVAAQGQGQLHAEPP